MLQCPTLPYLEEHSSVPFTHIEQSLHRGDLSEFLLRKGQEARSWSLGPDSPCWSTCFALGTWIIKGVEVVVIKTENWPPQHTLHHSFMISETLVSSQLHHTDTVTENSSEVWCASTTNTTFFFLSYVFHQLPFFTQTSPLVTAAGVLLVSQGTKQRTTELEVQQPHHEQEC